MRTPPQFTKQLRDATHLIAHATLRVADIVQNMHQRIASGPEILGKPLAPIVNVLTTPPYASIRIVTRIVTKSIERLIVPLEAWLPLEGMERGAFLAALNGVLGDYLAATNNSLAISMSLCFEGKCLSDDREQLRTLFPEPRPLLILFHGSSVDEQSWDRAGWNYGRSLAEEYGYYLLYVRYNTGLHISENGLLLSQMLDRLEKQWPWPISKIAFLGHSMGGLLALSTLHQGHEQSMKWPHAVHTLVTLGTPFHGSPLERTGNWVDAALEAHPYTEPLAQLGKIRSAGVTDLRYGFFLEQHWQGRDRFARGTDPRPSVSLPAKLRTCVVAASRSKAPGGRLLSDGLVPVASALGQHKKQELCLPIPEEDQLVIFGAHHLDLLAHPTVYAALKDWLKNSG